MEWKIKCDEGLLLAWLQANDFDGSCSRDPDGVLTLHHAEGGTLHYSSDLGKMWTNGSARAQHRLDMLVITALRLGKEDEDESFDPDDDARPYAPDRDASNSACRVT